MVQPPFNAHQVAILATFGGDALRSGEIGELLQEATQLVSDAIGGFESSHCLRPPFVE
jgi:hypothetical protein